MTTWEERRRDGGKGRPVERWLLREHQSRRLLYQTWLEKLSSNWNFPILQGLGFSIGGRRWRLFRTTSYKPWNFCLNSEIRFVMFGLLCCCLGFKWYMDGFRRLGSRYPKFLMHDCTICTFVLIWKTKKTNITNKPLYILENPYFKMILTEWLRLCFRGDSYELNWTELK